MQFSAFPETKPLLPKDPFARARTRLVIDHISKNIVAVFFKLVQSQEEDKQAEARQTFIDGLKKFVNDSLDGSISKNGFWAGSDISLADIALIPFLMRLYILEEHRGFKKEDVGSDFVKYFEKVTNLDSVKRTTSDKEHYAEIYGRYLRNEAQSEAAKATRSGSAIP